ncbi:MAG: ATP-grasp domain-containing protein [Isosphaeraceae bacterium]|nr:ATP-grasp domain-containing protein [Isosphaeraceae bacterium]
MPWLYTGSLENYPELVDQISKRHHLLGNAARTLSAVRDPLRVRDALEAAGLPSPRVGVDGEIALRGGRWLTKPLASAGGLGIREFDGLRSDPGAVYYQEWIDGPSLSSLFLGGGGEAEFVGAALQLIGRPGAPFAYAGNLGPWPLSTVERKRVERLGAVIGSTFRLVGLFGVDFILRDSWPWVVEINPRYTASVEVLELATGRALLEEHVRACGGRPNVTRRPGRTKDAVFVGKRIVFADRPCRFPSIREDDLMIGRPEVEETPAVADIPQEGEPFQPGDPVLTVFARGTTVTDCFARLQKREQMWIDRLGGDPETALR